MVEEGKEELKNMIGFEVGSHSVGQRGPGLMLFLP